MTTALTTLEAPSELVSQVEDVITLVENTKIETDTQLELSGEVLDSLDMTIKKVGEHFDPGCQDADKLHKARTGERAKYLSPLKQAVLDWRSKISVYNRIVQARVEAEQKKLEAEALKKAEDEKINLAAELEKTGQKEQAHAVIEDTTPPIIVTPKLEAPKAQGVSLGQTWNGELVSLPDLVRAIASGSAPISLLKLDKKGKTIPIAANLKRFAKATSGSMQVPGVRFYPESTVGRKGKRGKS